MIGAVSVVFLSSRMRVFLKRRPIPPMVLGVSYLQFSWKTKRLLGLPRWAAKVHPLGNASEFRSLFAQLREASANLKTSSASLETQFLATSSELGSLAEMGNAFVKHVEKLVGLATGKDCDHTVFSNAIELIQHSTQFLSECQAETGRMLETLRRDHAQIERLLGMEVELQRTMLPLKFVQTLFKSESAPLGPGVQQMFTALTHEIESLHGQVREIFGTKFKQLEETRHVIGQVIGQLEEQARSLEKMAAVHKAQIETSLKTLQQEMSANQERDHRLNSLTQNLAREMNQIVMGVQFQDIVNQKLQHVTAALEQVEATFERLLDKQGSPLSEPLQFLYQSCRLEAEQVQSARDELATAETSIRDSIQKVLTHLTEVDAKCLTLEDFKLLTTSYDGMVQVLVETLEEVRELVTATVAGATQVYEILKPLGNLASDLTVVVRELSVRIHLIGLNAQVQAAWAAQDHGGSGLEVLAARTSEISEETNRISEQAATALDALTRGLAENVEALEQLRSRGISQQSVLNDQGVAEEQRLHAFRDRALDALRDIGTSLDRIRKQAEETLATVQYTRFHQITLPALREPLVAIANLAEMRLRLEERIPASTLSVEGFKRDYTMASEHEVFADVISAQQPSTSSVAAGAVSEMAATLAGQAEGGQSGVSLAAEPPLETPVAVAKSDEAKDFGANVELF